jgi:hypothetical protein
MIFLCECDENKREHSGMECSTSSHGMRGRYYLELAEDMQGVGAVKSAFSADP